MITGYTFFGWLNMFISFFTYRAERLQFFLFWFEPNSFLISVEFSEAKFARLQLQQNYCSSELE